MTQPLIMQVNPSRVVALSYSLKSAESLDKPGTGRPAAGDDNQAVRQILEILDFPLTFATICVFYPLRFFADCFF
jgi:hypothetical protein